MADHPLPLPRLRAGDFMVMMMQIILFLSLACLSVASYSPPPPPPAAAAASCAGTTTPFCGSSSCCRTAQEDLKLREAFLAEVKAHGYEDAACRFQLKAYFCAVCLPAAAPAHNSALPLRCAGAVAPPPSISTTRHHDDLGGTEDGSRTTLCVQQVSTQAYDGVVPLHDGSGRLLCWRRNGQIWLATVDVAGGSVLRVGDSPVVDLGTRVSQEAAARGLGLAGVAVHYSTGRLFASYYTTHVGGGDFLVVDELSTASSWSELEVNGKRRSHTAQARNTRVFSMALPAQAEGFLLDYYCGQILFRPTDADSFLYLVTGLAQSDAQLQAKIQRFRVGGMPAGIGSMEVQVYASVLGIPRRCAFDADKPHDLYCAITKEDQEVIYLISDGPSISDTWPSASLVVAHQRPTPGTPPSIVGGLLYQGYADNTLMGSYIFMESSEIWWTVTSPAGNYTTTRNLRVTCAAPTATSRCHGGVDFAGGSVSSFAEDADKNALLLAADGVYMVVQPSLCDTDDDTHTDEAPTFLKWIFGVVGSLITILGGGYGAYKTCNCFSRRNHVTVNATNASIHNGDNEIQLTVISTER